MELRSVELIPGAAPVHYLDFGGQGTPLVMVHGLGGNALNWMAVGPRLAAKRRVLALDLPGFGASLATGWKDAGAETAAEVVDRFVAALAGPRAVLVGNSMGGLVSLMAASSAPESVSALVLVDPAQPLRLGMPVDWDVTRRFATYALPLLGPRQMRERARRLGPAGLVDDMLKLCCVDAARVPEEIVKAHVDHVTERIRSGAWTEAAFLQAAKSLLQIILRPGRFAALTHAEAPTLVISGTHDRLVPHYLSEALVRARPGWTLRSIPDSGHVPMLEHPREFTEVVERWLESRGL